MGSPTSVLVLLLYCVDGATPGLQRLSTNEAVPELAANRLNLARSQQIGIGAVSGWLYRCKRNPSARGPFEAVNHLSINHG